jgi:UDP-N-acetyl-2-amino-2-deoxyglucuronate dehydrogenase
MRSLELRERRSQPRAVRQDGSVALAETSSRRGRVDGPARRIRFGLAGVGKVGLRHFAVIDAEAGADVVAVCDIDPEARRRVALLRPGLPVFEELGAMLHGAELDVVNVCTPHALHAPMSIEIAAAGRHVLVEKPMSLTSGEAEQMITAARDAGVLLMVVKQNRYNIPVVRVRRLLEEGGLGRLLVAECSILWNRDAAYYAGSPWRGRKAMEGGALYTQASHFIDLLICFLGDVVDAKGVLSRRMHDIEFEDCGVASLVFSSGATAGLVWTTCTHERNYEGSITLVGERGTVRIGGEYLNRIEHWNVSGHPPPAEISSDPPPNIFGVYQGSSSNHDKVIRDVVRDLVDGGHRLVDGKEAAATVRAIERIYGGCRYV